MAVLLQKNMIVQQKKKWNIKTDLDDCESDWRDTDDSNTKPINSLKKEINPETMNEKKYNILKTSHCIDLSPLTSISSNRLIRFVKNLRSKYVLLVNSSISSIN